MTNKLINIKLILCCFSAFELQFFGYPTVYSKRITLANLISIDHWFGNITTGYTTELFTYLPLHIGNWHTSSISYYVSACCNRWSWHYLLSDWLIMMNIIWDAMFIYECCTFLCFSIGRLFWLVPLAGDLHQCLVPLELSRGCSTASSHTRFS